MIASVSIRAITARPGRREIARAGRSSLFRGGRRWRKGRSKLAYKIVGVSHHGPRGAAGDLEVADWAWTSACQAAATRASLM